MGSENSQVFLKFGADLIVYALHKENFTWRPDISGLQFVKQVFKPEFGEAVLFCRNLYSQQFTERVHNCPEAILDYKNAFENYLKVFIEENFQGGIFLLEILRMCAFMVDIAIFAYKNGQEKFINICPELMEYAFVRQMGLSFEVIGGYSSLYRFAEQYMEYNKLGTEQPVEKQETLEGNES